MAETMTDRQDAFALPMASLEELQHWTSVLGRMQQMLIEYAADTLGKASESVQTAAVPTIGTNWIGEAEKLIQMQTDLFSGGMKLWQEMLTPGSADAAPDRDRRFAAPQWHDNPLFDMIRQTYLLLSDRLLKGVDTIEGLEPRQREQLRFATRSFVDALSPSNFVVTNPQVIERTIATHGENLLTGVSRMLGDIRRGQLTHTDESAFELGINIAATPGKVIRETPLYQLIQYTPTTKTVDAIPLLIVPPWINRFYVLDLNPKNSFIKWALDQGLSVFVISWKSADATLIDVTMDDYVLRGIVDAIDTVRAVLDVPAVHSIGYCVAGTALSMALAWLAEQNQADKVASATFFTAQVDFSLAGELTLLVDDQQLQVIESLSAETGYLDGRYMTATFNLLRGRDLIWNYVVQNYLLAEDYPAFDLLYWNSDTTNLPAKWHGAYLRDFYRDNRLIEPDALRIDGTPIDLRKIRTPTYIQAGRDDHIAPPASVWKLTEQVAGPTRFILAGSGHIAGVVNPPAAGKYQYWTNSDACDSLDSFISGATEHKGSWWPDWRQWIESLGGDIVKVTRARIPGKGKLSALEDAPGRYVRTR